MSLSENLRAWLLEPILANQTKELKKMSVLSDAIQAVSDKLSAVESGLATFKVDFEKALADLLAKIQAGNVSQADLDALAALSPRLDAISSGISTLDTEAKDADQ